MLKNYKNYKKELLLKKIERYFGNLPNFTKFYHNRYLVALIYMFFSE